MTQMLCNADFRRFFKISWNNYYELLVTKFLTVILEEKIKSAKICVAQHLRNLRSIFSLKTKSQSARLIYQNLQSWF
jgi:hypothetical protein